MASNPLLAVLLRGGRMSSAAECVLGNRGLSDFDALIVGSGAGGSAVAHVLAQEGWKVLVLEAGNNYFPGLDQPGKLPWYDFSGDEVKMPARGLRALSKSAKPAMSLRRGSGAGVVGAFMAERGLWKGRRRERIRPSGARCFAGRC